MFITGFIHLRIWQRSPKVKPPKWKNYRYSVLLHCSPLQESFRGVLEGAARGKNSLLPPIGHVFENPRGLPHCKRRMNQFMGFQEPNSLLEEGGC